MVMENIKHKMRSMPRLDVDRLIKRIEVYEYVSFDIFDTLIKRNVPNPQDVFHLVQLKYEKDFVEKLDNFKKNRILAEVNAQKLATGEEITLDDIYSCMAEYPEEIREKLKMLECKVELDICCINLEMISVYHWCQVHGKKIIMVSDMYLPKDIVESILRKNGINGYQRLYLSSDIGLRKRTGSLYDWVLNDLQIACSQIIHIGDSFRNDYLMARYKGIDSFKIPKYIKRIERNSNKGIIKGDRFSYDCIKSFINNHISKERSPYYRFGYEAFGLPLYCFNRWLLESLNNKGIKRVYFLSRDGYIMKQVFDLINDGALITSYYLYVSRRSLRVPQIWMAPNLEDVVKTFSPTTLLTVANFMDNIGLNAKDYTKVLSQYGLNEKDIIKKNDILANTKIVKLYEALKDTVINLSKQEYNILIKYLKQNELNGKVAVVDIGWHGSLQHSLIRILEQMGINADIHGFYFGVAHAAKHYTSENKMNMKGYVFDCNSRNEHNIKPFLGLIELLFSAQEGSTRSYEYDGESKILPVLHDYEYYDDGKLTIEAQMVEEIQTGALDFVKDLLNYNSLKLLAFDPMTSFRNIFYTGMKPTKKDLEMFAGFRFLDGEVYWLAAPKNLAYYCLHPKILVKDFYFSGWKIGFMKKLLKVPLPYGKIYWLLKKI